jgi:hypothetical protein
MTTKLVSNFSGALTEVLFFRFVVDFFASPLCLRGVVRADKRVEIFLQNEKEIEEYNKQKE